MTRAVVIVEPEIPENTGFIARLASNFNYEMRIVDPDFNLSEARTTASSAQNKLREARIFETVEKAVKDLEYVVGTKPGRGQPVSSFEPPGNTSIMIGRESSGLSSEELEMCDSEVHIETGQYSSVNQSHAAAILLHRFYQREEPGEEIEPGQKEVLEKLLPESAAEAIIDSISSGEQLNSIIGDLKHQGFGTQ